MFKVNDLVVPKFPGFIYVGSVTRVDEEKRLLDVKFSEDWRGTLHFDEVRYANKQDRIRVDCKLGELAKVALDIDSAIPRTKSNSALSWLNEVVGGFGIPQEVGDDLDRWLELEKKETKPPRKQETWRDRESLL